MARAIPPHRLIVVAALLSGVVNVAAADEGTVVVLYSDPSLVPASAAFTDALRQGLPPSSIRLEAQYLDISRFAGQTEQEALVRFLSSRYQHRDIAVVVAVGVPASAFATRLAAAIWPRARVMHAGIDGDQLEAARKRGDPVVPRVLDYRSTVEAALSLMPAVREVTLVAGDSEQDRRWLDQAEGDLAPLRGRIRITRLAGLRWQEILERVRRLPEHAIAVPVCFFADADGRTFVTATAVPEIARAANRPAFVTSALWVGSGAVGGYVMDPNKLGQHSARAVQALLNYPDRPVPPARDAGNRWLFDDVQLRRWHIPVDALPEGSVVINREPSLWSQYRWYALGALSVIAAQALLIGGLLVQRIRRRRAEQLARTSEAALRMSYERIRQLAARLIGAQETARTRIARDLHDDVCQELAILSMAIGDLSERLADVGDSETRQALSALQARAHDLVQGVRRLSHDLHPSTLRHVGLATALEAHCIEVEQRYDVQVSVATDADLRELPGDTAVALYRIAQEALRNAATHGNARRVTLSITGTDDTVELVVRDDGRGFDREEIRRRGEGLGLVSIEERARLVDGEAIVVTAPGQGATIRVRVPRAPASGRSDDAEASRAFGT